MAVIVFFFKEESYKIIVLYHIINSFPRRHALKCYPSRLLTATIPHLLLRNVLKLRPTVCALCQTRWSSSGNAVPRPLRTRRRSSPASSGGSRRGRTNSIPHGRFRLASRSGILSYGTQATWARARSHILPSLTFQTHLSATL